MQTRSASLSVENTQKNVETEVGSKKKEKQKQNTDALDAGILTSIQIENSTKKAGETNNSASGSKKMSQKMVVPKTVRGLPKSGRPWKETKQK